MITTFNVIKGSSVLNDKINLFDYEYPLFLPENTSIKYCEIEDIGNIENYFYIIGSEGLHLKISKNGLIIKFTDNITHALRNYNVKVIFISPHESPTNLEEFIEALSNTIKINNWNESQFYIINNNSSMYDLKNKLNININFYKMNYLLRFIYSDLKSVPSEEDIYFNKKFIFLCLNRNPWNHRIALLTHLKNLKLLENDITDWSWVNPYDYKPIKSIYHLKKFIKTDDKNLIKNYLEITGQRKLSFYEENVDCFSRASSWEPYYKNGLDYFKNTYINIVTETYFEFKKYDIHITEKSFKPFYYFQLPIFLAPPNHIKMMREEYDLDFFDDLIDHSYDNEIDDTIRFQMVVNEIKRLSTMRDEISIYYKNNIDKLIHNHNFIKTYSKKQIEEKYFLDLINKK
jgi:hypothetical protein